MTIVFEDLNLPGGGNTPVVIEVTLWGAGQPVVGQQISTGLFIAGTQRPPIDSSGIWQLDLVPNSDITPANTSYQIEHNFGCDVITTYISVPITGGPFNTQQIEVDAMNTIAPAVLGVHAGDILLHGGGIELDYAEIVSSIVVTGDANNLAVIPGLAVEVPDLPRPVYVYGRAIVQSISGTVDIDVGISFWNGSATLLPILGHLDIAGVFGVTTTQSIPVEVLKRIPPHTPGLVALTARRNASPFAVRVIAFAFAVSSIRAIAA